MKPRKNKTASNDPPRDAITAAIAKERFLTRLSLLLLIAGAAAAFLFLFGAMYRIGIIRLPDFLSQWLPGEKNAGEEVNFGNDSRLYAVLNRGETESGDSGFEVFEISPEKVAEVFQNQIEPEEYSVINTVRLAYGNRMYITTNKIWKSGEKYRIECYDEESVLKKIVVCDGNQVWISIYDDNGNSSAKSYPVSEAFSMESQAGMPQISLLQQLAGQEDGDGVTVSNFLAELEKTADDSTYKITFERQQLDQREEYSISLKYMLMVNAAVSCGGREVYRLKTVFMSPSITGYEDTGIFTVR